MGRRRSIQEIKTVVIHCAATPNGKWVTAEDIDSWHASRFKRDMSIAPEHSPQLKHIGYHFIIYTTGAVVCGRPLIESGAHVKDHNKNSIGICMVGTDQFTEAQWDALAGCINGLRSDFKNKHNITLKVTGHRDLSPDVNGDGVIQSDEWLKICPGFSVSRWLTNGMKALKKHVFQEDKIQCAEEAKNQNFYRVKAGDSLWSISRDYEISLAALKHINGLVGDKIIVGQRLVVTDV